MTAYQTQTSKLLNAFRTLVPHLKRQEISLLQDLKNRPATHFKNVAGSSAVNFGIGNTFFAAFIGNIAGIDIGPLGAAGIQLAVTSATAMRQVASTYNGESHAAPFRIQAAANFATALMFAANAISDGLQGKWAETSMMVLPVATFISWGAGHWSIAEYLDRLEYLKSQNIPEEKDPLVQKLEKRFLTLYGTADIVAPWKNMPVDEVAKTLADLVMKPSQLTGLQWGSIISIPFFIGGLVKTFSKGAIGKLVDTIENKVFKSSPNPNHYYACGYGIGSAFAAASGLWLFAGAQASWANAYRIIGANKAAKNESADEYISTRLECKRI